jgi:DNA-binding MarR family transcriptional regulator
MTQDVLESAAMDLLQIPPLIHRHVRRALSTLALQDPQFNPRVTKQQFEILITLEEEGTQQVAEIGKKLHIAKAQMTQLLDKLSKQAFIERSPSQADRRVINVSLSAHGRVVLAADKEKLRQATVDLVATLSDADLIDLSVSLQKVRDIVSRIDQS